MLSQNQDDRWDLDGNKDNIELHSGPDGPNPRQTEAPSPVFASREESSPLMSGLRSKNLQSGWRKGISSGLLSVSVVLLINIVFAIWASVYSSLNGGTIGTISEGQCSIIRERGRWIHVVINGLSTLLLGASNYAMQCVVAPTRADIDVAHQKGDWLEIGIPSIRNLSRIPRKRVTLWFILALSSIPLHLLYNSVIFEVISANDYAIAMVTKDFAQGGLFNDTRTNDLWVMPSNHGGYMNNPAYRSKPSDFPFRQLQENITQLERLSATDCINAYRNPIISDRRNLFAVTPNNTYGDGSLVIWTESYPFDPNTTIWDPIGWICNFLPRYQNEFTDTPKCNVNDALAEVSNWTIADLPIESCLSQRVEEQCQLQFSLTVLCVVIACNLAKLVAMGVALKHLDGRSLMTAGDAISSFLNNEDSTTVDLCLVSKKDLPYDRPWTSLPRTPRPYRSKTQFWFSAASTMRWVVCLVLCAVALGVTGWLLQQGLDGLRLVSISTSISSIASMGLGSVSTYSLVRFGGTISANNSLTGYILLVNLPQLILSGLYLLYNALYSAMLTAQEWASYGKERQYLRVSSPEGKQRSTYWLNLPYQYGIPLLVASAILHWLVSQSIFLVRVEVLDVFAIICTIVVGSAMVLACILLGLRRSATSVAPPLAANCSFVFSAACHPGTKDKPLISLESLMWGAMEDEVNGVGHCSLSPDQVVRPVVDKLYA